MEQVTAQPQLTGVNVHLLPAGLRQPIEGVAAVIHKVH